jgi:hypothetical protein
MGLAGSHDLPLSRTNEQAVFVLHSLVTYKERQPVMRI